ncbi:hypothetical protein SUGI_0052430 [Cryptomeria japonica]|nr:hypothetical protein SUGI_0052430 [Cryptomeria japonica]
MNYLGQLSTLNASTGSVSISSSIFTSVFLRLIHPSNLTVEASEVTKRLPKSIIALVPSYIPAYSASMPNKDGMIKCKAGSRAGKMISTNFYKDKTVEHKGKVDLVTETDKACEELVFKFLKEKYPDHQFIGEETSTVYGTSELTDEPTWIIDPVDGTTNFVHRFSFVCISIGLTIGKVPTVGVVYNPIIDELFTAVRGRGAHLNGQPISSSSQSEIGNALLAAEVGVARDKETVDATTKRINGLLFKDALSLDSTTKADSLSNVQNFEYQSECSHCKHLPVRSLRMSGSCALNLCGIACGRLDIYYELGFGGPWDVAAGVVIIQEAGGSVFDPSGGEVNIMTRKIAASNGFLKHAFVNELNELGL